MKYNIYSVYDAAAEGFLQPFFMTNKGQAVRAFSDLANDPSHNFGKHPEDYTLFELGEYDDKNAQITQHQTPVSLGLAVEFKKQA
jgi:hypothetical protein